MSTYVPASIVNQLISALDDAGYIGIEDAERIAMLIAYMVDIGVGAGVEEARGYVDKAIDNVNQNMDKSLNYISEWVRAELDNIIDTFGPALSQALEMLADAQLMGQENTVQYLDQSYDAVADSHQLVQTTLEGTIDASTQASLNAYKLVQESIDETTGSVWESVQNIIKEIVDIPQSLIGQAISALVPAQALAALKTGWDFISSGPFEAVLNIFSNIFVGAFGTLLVPDEKVVAEYIQKFMLIFQQMGADELTKSKGG